MQAPYAAQYCVIGGSGAGNGGSFTLDAAFACSAPLAAASDAPMSALADADADAGVAPPAVVPAGLLVGLPDVDAPAAVVVVAAPLAADAPAAGAAAGMLALIGAAEKVLGGKGGRAGTPVDVAWVTGGLRGGICDSCMILTLVFLVASA